MMNEEEYFKPKENTLDFKHFNLRSDSVLKNMNKDKLIEYIHMLYHNWSVADEICQNLMNNAGKLKMDNLEDIKAYLDTCIRYWRSKRDKENCEYAIYYIDCFQSVRSSIFGKCLPVEEKKQIPICKELKNMGITASNQIIEILNNFDNYWNSIGAITLPKELFKEWLEKEENMIFFNNYIPKIHSTPRLITDLKKAKATEKEKIVYLCDHRECKECNDVLCKHTSNIEHAKNFEKRGDTYFEQSTNRETDY